MLLISFRNYNVRVFRCSGALVTGLPPLPPEAGGIVTGHRSLVTGHWLLVTGYWLPVTGYWLLVTGHCSSNFHHIVGFLKICHILVRPIPHIMKRVIYFSIFCVFAGLFFTQNSHAQSVIYLTSEDVYVDEEQPGLNFNGQQLALGIQYFGPVI